MRRQLGHICIQTQASEKAREEAELLQVTNLPPLDEGSADIGAREDGVPGILTIKAVVRACFDDPDLVVVDDVIVDLLVEPAQGKAARVLEIILEREIPILGFR